MKSEPEDNGNAKRQRRRIRAVAIAAIGMLVILAALNLLLPIEVPSGFQTVAISGSNYGSRVHTANRVMMFSGYSDVPNGYSWYTGFGYAKPRTASHPRIPYRSVKQSLYFETMPVLGPDGKYHESGYMPAGWSTNINSAGGSCGIAGSKESDYFETMPVLGPDGKYHESGYIPESLE